MGNQALNESDFMANRDHYFTIFNQVFAVGLNLLVIAISNMSFFNSFFGESFKQGISYIWYFIYLVSFLASYNYFSASKRYEMFKFEELYYHNGGNPTLKELRQPHPDRYFRAIHDFYTSKYPNMTFEFRFMKADQDYEI